MNIHLSLINLQVKEVASPCCFAFIGYIIPQVQWQEIIDYSKSQLHPEVACRMQTGVAILLMQSYIDTEMAEVCTIDFGVNVTCNVMSYNIAQWMTDWSCSVHSGLSFSGQDAPRFEPCLLTFCIVLSEVWARM